MSKRRIEDFTGLCYGEAVRGKIENICKIKDGIVPPITTQAGKFNITEFMSWAEAELGMVTSTGVSWLGDIAGKAVDGIVSAATTVGKVTANVVRSAVNAVGNVINSVSYLKQNRTK